MVDSEVELVREYFSKPRSWYGLALAIEKAYNWVLDEEDTGYTHPDQLSSQAKSMLGIKIEECALARLGLPKVKPLDTVIEGIPIDFKHSIGSSWMIPPEAIGHVCVLIKSNWDCRRFDVGVLRITDGVLRPKANRDKKRGVKSEVIAQPDVWTGKKLTFKEVPKFVKS